MQLKPQSVGHLLRHLLSMCPAWAAVEICSFSYAVFVVCKSFFLLPWQCVWLLLLGVALFYVRTPAFLPTRWFADCVLPQQTWRA